MKPTTRNRLRLPALIAVAALVVAACGGDDDDADDAPADEPAAEEPAEEPADDMDDGDDMADDMDDGDDMDDADHSDDDMDDGDDMADDMDDGDEPSDIRSGARDSEWYDEAEYELQLSARSVTPEGPEGEPWNQAINPTMLDTSEYAAPGGTLCFSNVDVGNPWRVVGWTNMQQEILAQGDRIGEFIVRDAGGSQEQQIADIEELVGSGDCDLLLVSPASTAALTPAVEAACEELPVIVFDRGVETDCPLTFIKPIGGYAFGADAADFLAETVPEGGNILALRILPGVDVLETRFVSAQIILEELGYNFLAAEFTEGDNAKVKSIIQDIIDRGETIDGVYMDAGANAVAAIEAFQENGLEVPPINGEDQQDFLQKWSDEGLTALAPTYPTYQWRSAIIASAAVLNGEEIPGGDWLLPQPVVNQDNLASYLQPDMPPLHYALCGCEGMDNFPSAWQG